MSRIDPDSPGGAGTDASAPPILRHPYTTDATDELVAFALAHPAVTFPPSLLRRLIAELTSSPDAVIDLRIGGLRSLLAVVIDLTPNATDAANLDLLGFRPPVGGATAGHDAPDTMDAPPGSPTWRALDHLLELGEAVAARGPRRRIETPVAASLPMPAALLEQRGYREAYRDYRMERPEGLPLPPPPPPLPATFRWVDGGERWIEAQHRLMTLAFADVPSANITPLEVMRRAPPREIPIRLLVDGDRVVGCVNVELAGHDRRDGEICLICRHPDLRGVGLGNHLLHHAMSLLAERGATRFHLSATASNSAALSLYHRFDFHVTQTFRIFQLELSRRRQAR
jgi:ribosomal protein S18 acetylase RimI-like enzyme